MSETDHSECRLNVPAGERRRTVTDMVEGNGGTFRLVRYEGHLFVCSRSSGSCCCGHGLDGRGVVEDSVWEDEWARRRLRNRIFLTFTSCLGSCFVGNSALLVVVGRTTRFKELNQAELVHQVFDLVEDELEGRAGSGPDPFRSGHVIGWSVQLDAGAALLDNR